MAGENDSLVTRARSDSAALGQLYEQFAERVYRYCLYRLFVPEVAQDLTSAVFLAVAQGIRGFRGKTLAQFRTWVYAIAANEVNIYVRRRRRRIKLLEIAAREQTRVRGSGLHTTNNPDWPTLYEAILRLKPSYQNLITLRFFEGLRTDEIAEILDVKAGTVRVRLSRALVKLRTILQNQRAGDR